MAGNGRFTDDNIEDWDFRDPDRLLLVDPEAHLWYMTHVVEIVATESARLGSMMALVRHGVADVVTEDNGQYIVIKQAPFELVSDHWTNRGERITIDDAAGFVQSVLRNRFRERLTPGGRWRRKLRQSILREWQKNGRIKVSLLPRRELDDDTRLVEAMVGLRGERTGVAMGQTLWLIRTRLDELDAWTNQEQQNP